MALSAGWYDILSVPGSRHIALSEREKAEKSPLGGTVHCGSRLRKMCAGKRRVEQSGRLNTEPSEKPAHSHTAAPTIAVDDVQQQFQVVLGLLHQVPRLRRKQIISVRFQLHHDLPLRFLSTVSAGQQLPLTQY